MQNACLKTTAPRNRTLRCSDEETLALSADLLTLNAAVCADEIEGKIINQDIFEAAAHLPAGFVDLMIIDPPYNLTKNYHGEKFIAQDKNGYADWFEKSLCAVRHVLKGGCVFICVRGLENVGDHRADFGTLFSCKKSHHLGTRKRTRREIKLEK